MLPDIGMLELFLRSGADANARDADGTTSLHLFAKHLVMFAAKDRENLRPDNAHVQTTSADFTEVMKYIVLYNIIVYTCYASFIFV